MDSETTQKFEAMCAEINSTIQGSIETLKKSEERYEKILKLLGFPEANNE